MSIEQRSIDVSKQEIEEAIVWNPYMHLGPIS